MALRRKKLGPVLLPKSVCQPKRDRMIRNVHAEYSVGHDGKFYRRRCNRHKTDRTFPYPHKQFIRFRDPIDRAFYLGVF